jgi:hypothetical protein
LEYLVAVWYIFLFLVYCTEKNLAALLVTLAYTKKSDKKLLISSRAMMHSDASTYRNAISMPGANPTIFSFTATTPAL